MKSAKQLQEKLKSVSSEKTAQITKSFFKTGKNQYSEKDIFIGIRVPVQRKVIQEYIDLPLEEIEKVLDSEIHEFRFSALLILIQRFEKSSSYLEQKSIFDFYLKNIQFINNWDLVDLSAHKIIGAYAFAHREEIETLHNLSNSKSLWEERIAIVATWHFIKKKEFELTLLFAKKFLTHEHDLIQKAIGWMLREVGKEDINTLRDFLDKNANQMPRVMLRYSIEKLAEGERKNFLNKKSQI